MGRMLQEIIPYDDDGTSTGNTFNSIKTYSYDRNGNKATEKITTNKPGSTPVYREITYGYNNRNMLTGVKTVNNLSNSSAQNFVQYYYDESGNKLRMYTGLSQYLIISGLDKAYPKAYTPPATPGTTPTPTPTPTTAITPTPTVYKNDLLFSVTKYQYDEQNNLVKVTDPMGNEESYEYDLNGNVTKITDRNGNVITMGHDELNRMNTKSVSTPDGSGDLTYTYDYTLTGKKLSTKGGGVDLNYTYDDLGRLIKETETGGIVKEYDYDASDNRILFQVKYNNDLKMNLSYTYDQMNRLYQVIEDGTVAATYLYDPNGNRETLTYNLNGNSIDYGYNLDNKLWLLTNNKNGTAISKYEYKYYLDGNQESKTDKITGKVTSYAYDGMGRLYTETETQGTSTLTTTYTYDDYNNRKSMTDNESITTYDYDKNSRLLKETKTVNGVDEVTFYQYDKNGNQTFKKKATIQPDSTSYQTTFTTFTTGTGSNEDMTYNYYDGFNQLIKVTDSNKTYTYTYDGNGLRKTKTVDGVTTKHIWDGQNIVMELNGSTITAKYIRGINLIASYDGAGTKKYYLFNGHGDVIQLTGIDGNVVKTYDYDAFGNEKNPDANDTNVFRYCGEYFDKETGTIYLRARYYNPAIGRFTGADSYAGNPADPLSLNLYTYCANDPVNAWDPSGHDYYSEKYYSEYNQGTSNDKGLNLGWVGASQTKFLTKNLGGGMHFYNPQFNTIQKLNFGRVDSGTVFKMEFGDGTGIRLDYGNDGPIKKMTQVDGISERWHWNLDGKTSSGQKFKSTHPYGLSDHQLIGSGSWGEGSKGAFFNTASKATKIGGRVLIVAGAGMDIYEVATSDDPLRTGVKKAGGWAGAWGGAEAGGSIGATIGTFICPGPGTAIGGFIGGLGGGIGGYFAGEKITGAVVDR